MRAIFSMYCTKQAWLIRDSLYKVKLPKNLQVRVILQDHLGQWLVQYLENTGLTMAQSDWFILVIDPLNLLTRSHVTITIFTFICCFCWSRRNRNWQPSCTFQSTHCVMNVTSFNNCSNHTS